MPSTDHTSSPHLMVLSHNDRKKMIPSTVLYRKWKYKSSKFNLTAKSSAQTASEEITRSKMATQVQGTRRRTLDPVKFLKGLKNEKKKN